MEMAPSPEMICTTCGGTQASGPFGLRCARCVLSLVGDTENEVDGYVAELFPELQLEGKIAQGGFGAVYRAEHRRMRRPVALKFLDSVLARNPEALALFQQEMITVGALDDPGIVKAHDAGERDGHWYIIMELVEGMDCGTLVRKHGALPMAESCEIIRQAALALGHAHEKGVVHRDVKPGNVMVSEGTKRTKETHGTEDVPSVPSVPLVPLVPSSVKILDFGLAGLAVAPVFSQLVPTSGSTLFLGTLEYISPEQIECPATVDARADIYSLGATLWRLLSGKTPHGSSSPEMSLFVAMKRITSEPVPSLATVRPDLPKPLIQLCDAMLSLDREKRPASAAEVARLLEPWCAGAELSRLFTDGPLEEKPFVFPKKNRRRLWAAAAAVVGLAALGSLFLLYRPSPEPIRPVYSPALVALRQLDEISTPRFLTDDWETESETTADEQVDCARLLPDGDLAFRSEELTGHAKALRHPAGGRITAAAETVPNTKAKPDIASAAPDTGYLIWTQRQDPQYLHLGRARPDGTLLPSLTFDPSGDFDGNRREEMRAFRHFYHEEDEERRPWGFGFVTEGQVPPHTGLRVGDVLIADEGQRWLAPLKPFKSKDKHGLGALWRCRFDDDQPAQRLGEDVTLVRYPIDVSVSRSGVFLINRTEIKNGELATSDWPHRLLRWDQDGFHPCQVDQPLIDPSGIAADPLSTDLYVIEGALIASTAPKLQRLLRLSRTGPDAYTVQAMATHFGKLSACGIGFSADGKRLVLTDRGNRVMVVLKKRDKKD
jgi:serine/threonine protein kinase